MADQPLTLLQKIKMEVESLLTDHRVTEDYLASSRLRSVAHFFSLVVRSFLVNRCPVRAAALAYTTVLALVPVLVVVFSISATFAQKESVSLQNWVEKLILQTVPQLEQMKETDADGNEVKIYQKTLDSIFASIKGMQTGGLAAIATVMLIFVVISLLGSIEATLNDMWGVKAGRSWPTRIVQYWAAITLGPLILFSAAGITSLNQLDSFQTLLQKLLGDYYIPLQRPLEFTTGFLLGFLLLSAAFSAFFLLMPNTKVHWKAAVVGGLTAGFLVQMNSSLSIVYASQVAQNQSLFAGVAAVPIFLFGLYISWMIILLGAQVSYAFQNRRAYLREKQAENVNEHDREMIALRLMTRIGERFHTGGVPPSAHEMAESMRLSRQLVGQILNSLEKAKLISEVVGRDVGYAPARPLELITAHDIIHALRSGQGAEIPHDQDTAQEIVRIEFERIHRLEREAANAVTLQSLVENCSPRSSKGQGRGDFLPHKK